MPEKRIEIRWRDLDANGHVNQAVYLTFAEEVLDAWFRDRFGLGPGTVWDYVVARTRIEYRNELTQADRYVVGTASVVSVGKTSVTTKIELQAESGRVAADVETVTVAIERETRRPRQLTDDERTALLA